ncbi:hypothetical protein, partial [Wolbachia endosymbiont of Wuchereria bancrofti]|uniref:hypothetical protein n=1 Tax=Wolbachia endosymbiont of Wuchereria bancrofti TaxID=96496 RepID=UPI001C54D00A
KWPKFLSKGTESSNCYCLILYSFPQLVNGYFFFNIYSWSNLGANENGVTPACNAVIQTEFHDQTIG